MSNASSQQQGMGLADFVAKLVTETFESVIASSAGQEERMAAFSAAAELDLEAFAGTAITEGLLDAAAVRLFPGDQGGTALITGGPVPDSEALTELDIVLVKADVKGGKLTEQGVSHIRDGLALYLARQQRDAFRKAHAHGIPRIRVDKGVLRARVNFSTVETDPPAEEDAEEPVPGKSATPGKKTAPAARVATGTSRVVRPVLERQKTVRERLATLTPLQTSVLDSIRRTRLLVSTPTSGAGDGDDPEASNRSEAFGEVEIHFRVEV